ncbi:S8 family serine peptidase [Catalinimonas niigatensis]|uniref:S8 family serine peptidase n=1 Tax=Catalinimonas niigatensis TaxID=1397264 RepID=UPI0026655C08|nr:S8 family serine peptidase [Catalinimonas niigatensis]WPP49304.1 S8 family serine peptidase [Catalinimonas niigatensis]
MSYAQHVRVFSWPEGITSTDYEPHTLIVKIKDTAASNARQAGQGSSDPLSEIQSLISLQYIRPAVPQHIFKQQNNPQARQGTSQVHLENIYKIRLEDGQDLKEAIQRLLLLESVEYAEPYYLLKPLQTSATEYVPNDPAAAKSGGSQDYLALIHAYEAWAIEKGDTAVLIGILDTGIEFGHQDLADNLWQNTADPINGIDDDNDGYVDNFQGWDFADDDNDPSADQSIHGVQVSGVAVGTPDNKVGIAGTGFHSSYLPLKIFKTSDGSFYQGYEAIAYAADMGCKVINLSWGGANAYSNFGQDIINYAVLEKDAVVVAAAGNSGKFEDFYPASFNHVLSVAQTDAADKRRSVTTTSYFVDLTALGSSVYTTKNGDGFGVATGSSMATPQVAGTAALLRAYYPELNALQVMEKIRLSTDNIYNIGTNNQYLEQMGKGRLNMGKALTNRLIPALRMADFSYQNHVGSYAFYGDTLSLQANFTNYLSPTTAAAKVTLTSPSAYVTMLDSVFTIGALDTLQSVQTGLQDFRLYLHEDLPANEQLYFRLAFEDQGYTDYQYFFIVSSSDIVPLDNGKIRIAIGSNGDIGRNSSVNGFVFQGDTLAKHLGLVIAASQDSVSDNVISDLSDLTFSQNFEKLENARFGKSAHADVLLNSVFDDGSAEHPMNLRIEQQWLTNTSGVGQNYLISEYRMINQGNDSLFSLRSGMFADWDLGDALQNKANWDASYLLGYVHNDDIYSGITLLSGQTPTYYAIDKLDANTNTADLGSILSDSLRYAWLSQSIGKPAAGINGSGNDVAHLLGAELDTLAPKQHTKVAFALLSAGSLEELQQLVLAARGQYAQFIGNPPLSLRIYACIDSTVTIVPKDSGLYRFYKDALGKELLAEGNTFTTGALSGDTAVYLANIDKGYESQIAEVRIQIQQPEAAFRVRSVNLGTFARDTLFLNSESVPTVRWEDLSKDAVAWQWDFGNGFKSNKRHPSVQYQEEGGYTVSLRVSSEAGCESIFTRTLQVVRRAPKPLLEDQLICSGEAATIAASNTDQIKVYSDAALKNLSFSGDVFTTASLTKDTTFYVVNAASAYASAAVPLKLSVVQAKVAIVHRLDLSTASKHLLKFWSETSSIHNISALEWTVNGQIIGTGDTVIYDYGAHHNLQQSFNIELSYSVDNVISCQQSVSRIVVLKESPKPQLADQRVCRGESVTLVPENGEVFYFYADASLGEPIHKGKSLVVDEMNSDQHYYITNADSLWESEAIPVQVILNQFADFIISPDTVFLSQSNEVIFEAYALDPEVAGISWSWDLGDGKVVTRGARVSQQYDSMGIYQIRMIARSSDGCTNTVTKNLTVINVTSAGRDPEDINLNIYPNPSSGRFKLSNILWYQKEIMLHLYDRQGKTLFHKKLIYNHFPLEVDLHELSNQQLPDGLYFMELHSADKHFYRKLMLRQGE